jgi:hypothetical protein
MLTYFDIMQIERTKGRTVDLIRSVFKAQIIFFASDIAKMLIQTALEDIVLQGIVLHLCIG